MNTRSNAKNVEKNKGKAEKVEEVSLQKEVAEEKPGQEEVGKENMDCEEEEAHLQGEEVCSINFQKKSKLTNNNVNFQSTATGDSRNPNNGKGGTAGGADEGSAGEEGGVMDKNQPGAVRENNGEEQGGGESQDDFRTHPFNQSPLDITDFSSGITPPWTYEDLFYLDIGDEKKRIKQAKADKLPHHEIYPLSPYVIAYFNFIVFLQYKINMLLPKVKSKLFSAQMGAAHILNKIETWKNQQKTFYIRTTKQLFPELGDHLPSNKFHFRQEMMEIESDDEFYNKVRKKREREKSRRRNDEYKRMKKPPYDSSDEESTTSMRSDDSNSVPRGRVSQEKLYSRKRVVETLKGDQKSKIHIQLNKRWSIYSDEAVAHRGLEEKFPVITICRMPVVNGEVLEMDEINEKKNGPKPYKMSFPLAQGMKLHYIFNL